MKITYKYNETSHEVNDNKLKLNVKNKICRDDLDITATASLKDANIVSNGYYDHEGYDGYDRVIVNIPLWAGELRSTTNKEGEASE